VAEVAKLIKSDLYINVQGDEPLFNPSDLTLLVNAATQNPDIVINGCCEIKDVELYMSRSIPKVVCDEQGVLKYMSRAPIPASKSGEFKGARRQVCAYSFPRELLTDFA